MIKDDDEEVEIKMDWRPHKRTIKLIVDGEEEVIYQQDQGSTSGVWKGSYEEWNDEV